MKPSHEVLKQTIAYRGAKAIAAEMNLSSALLYKWGQPTDHDNSGCVNPLDRILSLYRQTEDPAPVDWLCQQLDSFRVENRPYPKTAPETMPENLQSIIKEFSDLLSAATQSYEHGADITLQEADKIRQEWQELKSLGESFVRACEEGMFIQSNRTPDNTPSRGPNI